MNLIGQNVLVFDDIIRPNITMFQDFPRDAVDSAADRAPPERYDEIFVLRDGRLIERGGFDALMAGKGYFYSLYTISGT